MANQTSKHTQGNSMDSATNERFRRLIDLPPSAKFVYMVVDEFGPLNQSQIADQTLLPIRTIRHALSQLENENLIVEEPCAFDARRRQYSARPID